MKLCTHCNAQFDVDLSRCVHCGRPLRDAPAAEAAAPVSDVTLLTRREPIFAAPLLEALRVAQIPFELDPDGGTRLVEFAHGSSGHMARIAIFVPAGRLDEARELEARVLARELPDLPEDYENREDDGTCCPACGHAVGPSDAECADCGLAFPDAGS